MATPEDWKQAEHHLLVVMSHYVELLGDPGVMTMPALVAVFKPILKRYRAGERTEELLAEMKGVE